MTSASAKKVERLVFASDERTAQGYLEKFASEGLRLRSACCVTAGLWLHFSNNASIPKINAIARAKGLYDPRARGDVDQSGTVDGRIAAHSEKHPEDELLFIESDSSSVVWLFLGSKPAPESKTSSSSTSAPEGGTRSWELG